MSSVSAESVSSRKKKVPPGHGEAVEASGPERGQHELGTEAVRGRLADGNVCLCYLSVPTSTDKASGSYAPLSEDIVFPAPFLLRSEPKSERSPGKRREL